VVLPLAGERAAFPRPLERESVAEGMVRAVWVKTKSCGQGESDTLIGTAAGPDLVRGMTTTE